MKIRNLIIVFVLQLIVILGLFAYFYTQKSDIDPIVYLPIINKEGERDKLKFDISEIQDPALGYGYMSKEYNLNINIDDILYITLDQYGGKINGVRQIDKEYLKDDKTPIIKGKVIGIKESKPESGVSTKYVIEYGIEDLNFEPTSLVGAAAKVRLNSVGEPKIVEIYQDHKIIYQNN